MVSDAGVDFLFCSPLSFQFTFEIDENIFVKLTDSHSIPKYTEYFHIVNCLWSLIFDVCLFKKELLDYEM